MIYKIRNASVTKMNKDTSISLYLDDPDLPSSEVTMKFNKSLDKFIILGISESSNDIFEIEDFRNLNESEILNLSKNIEIKYYPDNYSPPIGEIINRLKVYDVIKSYDLYSLIKYNRSNCMDIILDGITIRVSIDEGFIISMSDRFTFNTRSDTMMWYIKLINELINIELAKWKE